MMRARLKCFALLTGLLLAGAPLFAHHGAAAYSDQVQVLKDATVTKFIWANPHCIVMFDVKDDKGNVTHWAGEEGSPSAVGLLGWNRNSLQPGDVITVYIYPAKSGSPVGRLNKVILPDGKTLRDSQLGGYNKSNDQ
jgi:Family of unknown function (DUF6152)